MARVLDADPDLGAGLESDELTLARQAAVAPEIVHSPGPWSFFPPPDQASLGILVLEGLLAVRLQLGDRAHLELLGEGDVISPWVGVGPSLALPRSVTAAVLSDVRMLLLSRSFTLRTGRWPEIHGALTQRLIARSRWISLQAAINAIPRTEHRVELTLWHLACRFGRMTLAGLVLPVNLTHVLLSEIVAAQRPSVSMAVSRLSAQGRVRRQPDGGWLLPGSPPAELKTLLEQGSAGP